jgi:hypothetical protein
VQASKDSDADDYNYAGVSVLDLQADGIVHPVAFLSASRSTEWIPPPADYRDRYERLTGRSLRECPVCHRGRMITLKILAEVRSSPAIKDTS